MLKRLFDIVVSLLLLLVLSPVLLVVALIIKLGSPGPLFYKANRAGRYKKPFKMFKFRSMVVNADKMGGPSTRKGDPRLTGIGAWLRRYKLDELPQLLNVVRGQMSLVGPRPEVPEYAELYKGPEEAIYKLRPGMTDFASLWDFHEEDVLAKATSTEEAERLYLEEVRPHKVELQMKYLRERSLWTDLKILAETAGRLVGIH
ncbi:hypothetical protein CO046_01065 [Candidatus Peregrinibacteria bacterium CG_4_9_14_0_2_um_filter_53_11]|nr:MAG: hypothetical protein CO046_01065 [Candidatus Peregrinibacteria bacterium CG_4_9_14_0_2_um_filter_53_11]